LDWIIQKSPIALALTWDSRLAELRKGLGHPSGRLVGAAQAVSAACQELRSGATLGAVSGVRSIRRLCSTIVLIAEVDTRRMVLAGTLANSRPVRENLALSCESIGEGERAPEAGPRRQSRGIGGGRCLRMWAEYVAMEGAPGPGKPLSLTRGREKRSLALHKYPVLPEILWRATGASEVCSSASGEAEKAPPRWPITSG
jgi:hypothetical protein